MNNDRENDSFRTSTDIYGGIDTDYDTQFVPYNGEDEVYEVVGGPEAAGLDKEEGSPAEKSEKRKSEEKSIICSG